MVTEVGEMVNCLGDTVSADSPLTCGLSDADAYIIQLPSARAVTAPASDTFAICSSDELQIIFFDVELSGMMDALRDFVSPKNSDNSLGKTVIDSGHT